VHLEGFSEKSRRVEPSSTGGVVELDDRMVGVKGPAIFAAGTAGIVSEQLILLEEAKSRDGRPTPCHAGIFLQ
jgi:hypothetical protein